MASNQATAPTATTAAIKEDKARSKVAIPFQLVSDKIIHYCTKTALENSLRDNFGQILIDASYDPIKNSAVVLPNNIEPPRASYTRASGERENSFVAYNKVPLLKNDGDYTVTKGKFNRATGSGIRSILVYGTINGLKIGRKFVYQATKERAEANDLLQKAGMKIALSNDLNDIILGASFPRLATMIAPNGSRIPADPSKVDTLTQEGWILAKAPLATKVDFHNYVDNY